MRSSCVSEEGLSNQPAAALVDAETVVPATDPVPIVLDTSMFKLLSSYVLDFPSFRHYEAVHEDDQLITVT